jgi:hypothetical protein
MKMSAKTISATAFLALSVCLLITACKKNSSPSSSNTADNTSAANMSANGAASDNAFDDAFGIALQTGNDQGLNSLMQQKTGKTDLSGNGFTLGSPYYCATVSVSGSTFPVTVTVDFGAGCKSADSVTRSGSITYVFSGKLSNPGTVISATFNNYVVNGYKLAGTYSITNTSTTSLSLTTAVKNGNITYPSDTSYSFAGSKMVTLASGTFTVPSSWVFNITGGYGIGSSYGDTLTASVTTPLVHPVSCKHVVSGIVGFTYTKGSASLHGTLDYGNGTCDSTALITIGAFTKTVVLP